MTKVFLSVWALRLAFATFDTQDNLIRTNDVNWTQNLNLETLEPLQDYGLWRFADNKFWVKTKRPAKTIRLNNYPYQYKVKKINNFYFEVKSLRLNEYFDNTDIIEVIIKH